MKQIALCIFYLCMGVILLFECTRNVGMNVGVENETSILYAAQNSLPEDTSGGILTTGIAKPTPSQSQHSALQSQAEYGALMRLLGEFRKPERLGLSVSKDIFFNCLETNITHVYIKRKTLPNGTVKIQIFIPEKSVGIFTKCLSE